MPETAYVTPIDTSSLSRSIASNGRGLVSPFRDVSYFKKKLYVFGLEKGMKLNALRTVDDAFQAGYQEKMTAMAAMTPEAAMFFEYRTILLFLQRYTDEIDKLEVTCDEYQKKVDCINYMIDELKCLHQRITRD